MSARNRLLPKSIMWGVYEWNEVTSADMGPYPISLPFNFTEFGFSRFHFTYLIVFILRIIYRLKKKKSTTFHRF